MQHIKQLLEQLKESRNVPEVLILDGKSLTLSQLYQIYAKSKDNLKLSLSDTSVKLMQENVSFLQSKLSQGCVIYGINTGYGGSANVRSSKTLEIQKSAIQVNLCGFGDTLPSSLVRAVMVARANSLCLGYSGVRPVVPKMLIDMVNSDLIPVVPKRGSVSASGDLMPTAYIAACMNGNDNVKIQVSNGDCIPAISALKSAGLEPIVFQAKEALAVINAASFASTLGACVLYDANIAAFMTQLCTAFTVEALQGRVESFHPVIHQCMPHPGQIEVARNICLLLHKSKFAIQELDMNMKDNFGSLKQDRYALRSSPQWLGPVVETLQISSTRISTEINSVNDNPIIDHSNEEIYNGANFQGTHITVAMDQTRQAIQLCGKLLFGQMQELVNVTMNNGLPPNLSGNDIRTDFGFKAMDIAMASYMSELDYLTNNMSSHVLSAELHNQAVNSMGLVSARYTQQALEILQMMIVNIMCTQVQAIDLRWLKFQVEAFLETLYEKYKLCLCDITRAAFPWYNFVFCTRETIETLLQNITVKGLDKELFITETEKGVDSLMSKIKTGSHLLEISNEMGQGTKKMYNFLRKQLKIPFYHGTTTLDKSLQTILDAIKDNKVDEVLIEILEYVCQEESDN